jgi:hypothetical protein
MNRRFDELPSNTHTRSLTHSLSLFCLSIALSFIYVLPTARIFPLPLFTAQPSFLPHLLAEPEFRSGAQQAVYKIGEHGTEVVIERLDPRWPWLPSVEQQLNSSAWYRLVYVGDACRRPPVVR